jgi:predicted nucleic acid-binding protein
MSDNILVDTNVLVYAYDRSEPEKQAQAIQVLDYLASRYMGLVSTQVLADFFMSVTRKITSRLSVEQAYASIENYLASWQVLDMTGQIILEAVRGVRDYQFSYYDAQIWAVARLNQVQVIFSEDFSPRMIEGVQFVNPFDPAFQIEDWV